MQSVTLNCHPASPSSVVRSIEVRLDASTPGVLDLRYVLQGAIGRVRLPPIRESRRADRLWEHTCFEMFARAPDAQAYRELNLAASSEWATYSFSGYREGMAPLEEGWQPRIATRRSDYRFELHVNNVPITVPARLALAAVIEEESGRLSYWALTHPAAAPDFHHRDSFALEL